MSDSLAKPWSDDPYAPQLPYLLYAAEENYFIGVLISAIFYGTTTHIPTYLCLPYLLACHSRDCHLSVLPMCGCVALSRTREGWRQMGFHGIHHNCIHACDDIHRYEPQLTIHLLHR